MGTPDIPIDKAELVSVLLEAVLYGFSLLMFGGTIWTLVSQRSTDRVDRKLLAVACALLLFSSWHLVIDVMRVAEGFILYRDSPGGPIEYFSDASQWSFVYRNIVFVAQTFVANGVVLYRCYAVWQSKVAIILPTLLWFAIGLTGIGSLYTTQAGQSMVFGWNVSQWITSFYALTFATNLLTTILLAYRIWRVDRKATKLHGFQCSQMRPLLHIIIDAGMIYSITFLAELICFTNKSNGQYVILDMITPIISITFYMVIIRVGLSNWVNHSSPSRRLSTGGDNLGIDRGSKLVHTMV